MTETAHVLTAPETLEGWAVLHEIYRIDWAHWLGREPSDHHKTLEQAIGFLKEIENPPDGESAIFSLLGHKGHLLLLHFRKTFDELEDLALKFQRLRLSTSLQITNSYVSYVEVGMYEMTAKLHRELLDAGLKPDGDEWMKRWNQAMREQRERLSERVYPSIPNERYFCFYPMNKKRGERKNWYEIPMEERQKLMRDHGVVGRRHSGQVTQIITGSIGFDDWEWGVYLFAKEPLAFKKLIYEMRFDEASAAYALFGPFYTGLRFSPEGLLDLMNGRVPAFHAA